MTRLAAIIFLLIPLFLSAQKHPTYISVEAGGNGILASVNASKPFIIHPNYRFLFQWGVGFSSEKSQSNYPIHFPAQIVCNIGKNNFFAEVGVGSSFIFESKLDKVEGERATNEWYLSPVLGVRYISKNWFTRLYACPLIHVSGEKRFDDLTSSFVKAGLAFGIVL